MKKNPRIALQDFLCRRPKFSLLDFYRHVRIYLGSLPCLLAFMSESTVKNRFF